MDLGSKVVPFMVETDDFGSSLSSFIYGVGAFPLEIISTIKGMLYTRAFIRGLEIGKAHPTAYFIPFTASQWFCQRYMR